MRRAYAMSLKLLVCLSVPLALLVTATAYPLVLLLGGRGYLPDAAVALQLLIWFLPLIGSIVYFFVGRRGLSPKAP